MQDWLNPLLMSSLLAGSSVTLAVAIFARMVSARRPDRETFEQSRRRTLRQTSRLYRWLEPLVDELASFFPAGHTSDQLEHHLQLSADAAPWTASEFTAVKSIEAVLIALAIVAFVTLLTMPLLGVAMAVVTGLMYPSLARKSVINRGNRRLRTIKLRLPFAIDQISLMMEAGAGFEDSLRTVVADNQEHPLSVELSEVIRQMSLGRPRRQALAGFRDRMADDDISEIVFAIVKGEELGTPLSNILREQAIQMRLKRSQWGEKAASEAEVQMVFPGMVTMIACLLVIIAPILLPVVIALLEN